MSEFKNTHTVKATLEVGAVQTWTTKAVDLAADTINLPSHGLATGTPVGLDSTGALPTGLTALTTAYYVYVVDSNHIKFYDTKAHANAGGSTGLVNLSAVGSGTGKLYPNGLGTIELGEFIPDNAVIIDAFYDVVTTFQSVTADSGTIALQVLAANDLVSAIAISAATNVWDAGIHGTLITAPNLGADSAHDSALEVIALFAGIKKKMTSTEQLKALVAVDTLKAGKLNLYVTYVMSE